MKRKNVIVNKRRSNKKDHIAISINKESSSKKEVKKNSSKNKIPNTRSSKNKNLKNTMVEKSNINITKNVDHDVIFEKLFYNNLSQCDG